MNLPLAAGVFLGSPVFSGIVGALVLAASLVSLYLSLRERTRKALAYSVTAVPLASIRSEVRERVQVLFDGSPVLQASLVTVRFRNSGNREIRKRDFEEPISIRFPGAGAKWLDNLAAGEVEPKALAERLRVTESGDGATVEPLLTNQHDRFAVSFLVDGANPQPELSMRLAGIPEFTSEDAPVTRAEEASRTLRRVVSVVTAAGVAVGLLFAAQSVFYQSATPLSYDLKNPVATGCEQGATALKRVPIRTDRGRGELALMRSARCGTVWAEFRAEGLVETSTVTMEIEGQNRAVTSSAVTSPLDLVSLMRSLQSGCLTAALSGAVSGGIAACTGS